MNNSIIITGAAGGIGSALAKALDARGQRLVLVGRTESTLQAVAETLSQPCQVVVADIGDEQGRQTLVDSVNHITSIKALVHNAAINVPKKSLASVGLTEWRRMMAINVEGPLFLTQSLLSQLSGGRVLNISSGARSLAIPNMNPYCVSKAALYRLYEGFNSELDTVMTASVRPGVVETDMMGEMIAGNGLRPEHQQFYQSLRTNKQLLKPEMVARFITWLLLDVEDTEFGHKEWDIYDDFHHAHWANNELIPTFE